MFLETERLILRKFRDSDFADFCEFTTDPDLCRMMGRDMITDPGSARPTFVWLKDREPRGYALVLKETGSVIGNLTVTSPSPTVARHPALSGRKGCALSFSISRHHRRRGLMYEAVSAVIRQLFSAEAFDYINCGHFDFNTPSRRLQEKLGFTRLLTEDVEIGDERFTAVENILLNPHSTHANDPFQEVTI